MAFMFFSVGEEYVQFGMICSSPNGVTNDVYIMLLIQACFHVHVSLQLPRYSWGKLES